MDNHLQYLNIITEKIQSFWTTSFQHSMQGDVPEKQPQYFNSQGLAIIFNLLGKDYSGRILFDMAYETGKKVTKGLTSGENPSEALILGTLLRVTEEITHKSLSEINKIEEYQFTISTNSLYFGKKLNILTPKLDAHIIKLNTDFGAIVMSFGFEPLAPGPLHF